MKYFLHDTNAFDDEKISELWINYGYEGIGLFFTALEKIGRQEKPIKTDILKAQLHVTKRLEKCWRFIEDLGLISSINGESFNESLMNYAEKYKIKKEKTREKIMLWRRNQDIKNNVTGYLPFSNPSKVKESKVKESKGRKKAFVPPTLNEFIDYFEINGFSKESAEKAWKGYDVADWHDSTGKKVLNWKQKAINVWFKDENKHKMSRMEEIKSW